VIMWELCTLNRPWEGVPPERVCWDLSQFLFQFLLRFYIRKIFVESWNENDNLCWPFFILC
jgi:hypothetical protein